MNEEKLIKKMREVNSPKDMRKLLTLLRNKERVRLITRRMYNQN